MLLLSLPHASLPGVWRILVCIALPARLPACPPAPQQDLAIFLSCLVLAAAAAASPSEPLVASPLFGVLVVLAMVEKLTSICSELAIERDWVTQLAGGWVRGCSPGGAAAPGDVLGVVICLLQRGFGAARVWRLLPAPL